MALATRPHSSTRRPTSRAAGYCCGCGSSSGGSSGASSETATSISSPGAQPLGTQTENTLQSASTENSSPSKQPSGTMTATVDGGALLDVYEGCTPLGMSTSSKAPPCTPSGMTIVNSSLPTVMVMASPGWRPAGTSTMMVDDGALCRLAKLSLDTARTRHMPSVARDARSKPAAPTAEAAIHNTLRGEILDLGEGRSFMCGGPSSVGKRDSSKVGRS